MKILKSGLTKDAHKYTRVCQWCGCTFEASTEDLIHDSGYVYFGNYYMQVRCPECKKLIGICLSAYDKEE